MSAQESLDLDADILVEAAALHRLQADVDRMGEMVQSVRIQYKGLQREHEALKDRHQDLVEAVGDSILPHTDEEGTRIVAVMVAGDGDYVGGMPRVVGLRKTTPNGDATYQDYEQQEGTRT